MLDVTTVSSDDVIASYRKQLSDAHHQIAVLEAQLAKAISVMSEREKEDRATRGRFLISTDGGSGTDG